MQKTFLTFGDRLCEECKQREISDQFRFWGLPRWMLPWAMLRKGYNASFLSSVMKICRRKQVDDSSCQSSLARVLNTFDLTALGIGSTLGVGIYVLAGDVSKTVAGPAVVISFLLAAIASLFAGLCYAEFGARVPKAGSAYIYSYYCVGEVAAFIIGWCLILEYVIGAASVARGISTYIDCLLAGKIKGVFMAFAPMEATFMSPYVDFFAFGLCIILAFALASGVRESTTINNFLTFCNMSLVTFIIFSGLFKIDLHNWQLEKSELPGPEAGEGGFAPFGVLGIIKGAAICFYGFIGFDSIATTGEEVRNPQKAIPLSILISLLITFLAYFGVSSVLTLMWPYYLQDPDAPLPYAFSQIGWDAEKWLVSVGALFGLFSSLYGAMFALPRIIYAMASDGLIFRVLSDVSPRTKTPVVGTVIAGMITATMSALFNLRQLISLMALGTLLAYTIVAVSVLILRYSPDFDEQIEEDESTVLVSNGEPIGAKKILMNYFSCKKDAPTATSKVIVIIDIVLYCISSLIVAVMLMFLEGDCAGNMLSHIIAICVFGSVMLISMLSLTSQPKARKCLPFQMPLVPLLPCISIFLNMYLMVFLDQTTWIKLGIWMCAGFIPYLSWYYWKFRHGELGENSRYNINRVNHIKFNELVLTLMREKQTRLEGYVNEAFVRDLEPGKVIPQPSTDSTEEKRESSTTDTPENKKWIYDEIYMYNENQKTVEIVEINNNIFKMEEPDDEKWRSVAEVHAVVEDEGADEVNKPEVEEKISATEESSPEGVKLEPIADEKEAAANNDNGRIQIYCEKNSLLEKMEEKVFGSEIPIRRRSPQKQRVKLNPDRKSRQNESVSEVPKTVVDPRSTDALPEEAKIKRADSLVSNEMREKLTKILKDQALFIQSGLSRPSPEVNESIGITPETQNHLDIKTLTKTEIMNKLQLLLKNGPPKKPSFRKPIVVEKIAEEDSQDGTG